MANCCSVGFDITFKTRESAEDFRDRVMQTAVPEDQDSYASIDLGAHDRWVLDPELSICDNVVVVDGWVKWAIELEDFLAILRNAGEDLVRMSVEFEEPGMGLKGTYVWRGGMDVIEAKLMDPDKWPHVDWDSDEYDPGEEERRLLDAAFEDAPVRNWSFDEIDQNTEEVQNKWR